MDTHEPPDQEPRGVVGAPGPEPTKSPSRRKALSSLKRDLSDEELASPAVQKLLLDEIERLEEENTELSGFRARFHDCDKRAAVLDQKSKVNTAQEIISLSCITIGGAALGYAPSVWNVQPTGSMALIFGLVLVLFGVFAKAIKS